MVARIARPWGAQSRERDSHCNEKMASAANDGYFEQWVILILEFFWTVPHHFQNCHHRLDPSQAERDLLQIS